MIGRLDTENNLKAADRLKALKPSTQISKLY